MAAEPVHRVVATRSRQKKRNSSAIVEARLTRTRTPNRSKFTAQFYQEHFKSKSVDLSMSKELAAINDLNLLLNTREAPFVLKTGIFTKQGGKVKTWKRRYFELLSNGLFVYFTNEKKTKKKGEIFVRRATSCTIYNPADNGKKQNKIQFGFTIKTEARQWYLVSQESKLCDQFIFLINQFIKLCNVFLVFTSHSQQKN